MDDRTLALLGDRAAQERITERGELLPCPLCGSEKFTRTVVNCFWCPDCCASISFAGYIRLKDGLKRVNTRAPVLTPEQIKRLEDPE